ncbi:hypothetical protein SCOR_31290 [Sulfidibacter corallicola]|uniref:Uncharacterized protein n=1 Tax=Sulfidibacter corallicola TaxID=2818388 RepID=A0A8A4TL88_SULCO|nr:hypothetical protein [Sulfidibacter corallicola]QTD49964.1 hypothetical protein J3U87_30650 [Sulfidibacter corallicola]
MRFKFFPGSELSPPFLLGGIVDLDKPQHLVANLFLTDENEVQLKPIGELPEQQLNELEAFAKDLPLHEYKRVAIDDIMHYTSRRRAMC